MYCQEDDDVEHTLFGCHRWHGWRHEVEIQVGRKLTPDNLIEAMLEKVENWKLIAEYMRKIMTCKEEDERKEEKENAGLRSFMRRIGFSWYARFFRLIPDANPACP
ncbi:hypothetical protein Zmor_006001 [Zophobas morio]|uniref:Reverse transcriptase n=1 Tax=Zophobas morio TaxID=2755281 RepID=A0AA38MMZ8_9CUCU|nr:hypothetical protein Zmor_006001 [Zophobas morio]